MSESGNRELARATARHLQRMLDALPRVYATHPGSKIHAVFQMLAAELGRIDAGLASLLRARWAATADGAVLFAGAGPALDLLGQMCDLRRMPTAPRGPAQGEVWEEDERYRRRLLALTRVIARGVTTHKAILAATVAAYGYEPCPIVWRSRSAASDAAASDAAVSHDSDDQAGEVTEMIGVPPQIRQGCAACTAGQRPPICPHYAQGKVFARVIDNPIIPRSLQLGGLRHGATFRIHNPSLFPDRPTLRLTVVGLDAGQDEVRFPALRNLRTGEVVLYAGSLKQGDVLQIRPIIEDSIQKNYKRPWQVFTDPGYGAVLIRGGSQQDVSASVHYLNGATFAGAANLGDTLIGRFAAPADRDTSRFAALRIGGATFWAKDWDPRQSSGGRFADRTKPLTPLQTFAKAGGLLRVPEIGKGPRASDEVWCYQGYSSELGQALGLAEAPPPRPLAGTVDLELVWRTRPPARCHLRILQMAHDDPPPGLLPALLARMRAAGVTATIEVQTAPPVARLAATEIAGGVGLDAKESSVAIKEYRFKLLGVAPGDRR